MLFVYTDFYFFENDKDERQVLKFVQNKPDLVYLLDNLHPHITSLFGKVPVYLELCPNYDSPGYCLFIKVISNLGDHDYEIMSEKEQALFDLLLKNDKNRSALMHATISIE